MKNMKAYLSFFRIRFINGMQYRAAAYAGVSTQFAWGGMTLLLFRAFYRADAAAFPMGFPQLTSYIWLQQGLLALFMAWGFENDIFDSITGGGVAYELCRPVGLYEMWFVRSVASRLAKTALRCLPIFVVAALLPAPFGLSLPASPLAALLFLLSMTLGLLVMVSITMLVYVSTFYTLSPMGIRLLLVSLCELFSGAIVPLPFMPPAVQTVFGLLPFASVQSTPLLVYVGQLSGTQAVISIILQLVWLVVLVLAGKLMMKNALQRVVVQGG